MVCLIIISAAPCRLWQEKPGRPLGLRNWKDGKSEPRLDFSVYWSWRRGAVSENNTSSINCGDEELNCLHRNTLRYISK